MQNPSRSLCFSLFMLTLGAYLKEGYNTLLDAHAKSADGTGAHQACQRKTSQTVQCEYTYVYIYILYIYIVIYIIIYI